MVRYVCIHTRRTLGLISTQALSGASREIGFEGAPLFYSAREGGANKVRGIRSSESLCAKEKDHADKLSVLW